MIKKVLVVLTKLIEIVLAFIYILMSTFSMFLRFAKMISRKPNKRTFFFLSSLSF